MRCRSCRTEIADDSVFCHNCGAAIGPSAPSVPQRRPSSRRAWPLAAGGVALALVAAIAVVLLVVQPFGGGGQPMAVSKEVIAADGDTVSLGDDVILSIPAGALEDDAVVTITQATEDNPPPGELEAATAVGPGFNIDLGGQKLAGPVALEIAFDPELLAEDTPKEALFLAFYDEEKKEWVPAGGRVGADRSLVAIEADHLSWWNVFTWNWDAWTAVLTKTLSLNLTDLVEAVRLLTEECVEVGEHVVADNAGSIIKGCVDTDDADNPSLRAVNLKSFYIGAACEPPLERCRESQTLSPGQALRFEVNAGTVSPPLVVRAEFTTAAYIRTGIAVFLQLLPAGELIPVEGIASFAEKVEEVFGRDGLGAIDALNRLSNGDAVGAAEVLLSAYSDDVFIDLFVEWATEFGSEHGIQMMTKWTSAGIKTVLKQAAVASALITFTDLIYTLMFSRDSAATFDWTVGGTPRPPTVPGSAPSEQLTWRASDQWNGDFEGPSDSSGRAWYDPDFDYSGWTAVALPDQDSFSAGYDRFYRTELELSSVPDSVPAGIASDDGIWLYVNGTLVGQWGGSWRTAGCVNQSALCFFSTITVSPPDIANFLVVGRNTIAVRVSNGQCCNSYFNFELNE